MADPSKVADIYCLKFSTICIKFYKKKGKFLGINQ